MFRLLFLLGSLLKSPIAEEYSKESYISLENKTTDLVTDIRITGCYDGKAHESTGMGAPEGEALGGGSVTLCIHKDSESKKKNLSDYSITVSVTDKNGNTFDVDTIAFPLEFGTDFQFELTHENNSFVVSNNKYAKG